ncbi:hypothetical protein SAMN05216604_10590 [Pseudomonas agarici]|nr:hypothetical protein SAMN05216604_10590 [Pseudomonas agarici]
MQTNGVRFRRRLSSFVITSSLHSFQFAIVQLKELLTETRRYKMSDVPPVSSGNADAAIAKMQATFDMAIEKSAKITELSTAKKAELDATKQRPSN